jgi:DNA-binding CsgD family transcriptional regulator
MLRIDAIRAATEELATASLLGEDWAPALERISFEAGARGVAVIRNRNRRLVAAVSTSQVAETVAAFLAGRAPPNSRQVRVNHDGDPGFRVDFDDYGADELARDAFYQEFLRPIGLFWHANARLEYEPGEELAISFKRDIRSGPYERGDAVLLGTILRDVKAAARIAHRLLDAEATGIVRTLRARGDPAFELDSWGRVMRCHGWYDEPGQPLGLIGRRLVAVDALAQSRLDRAVLAATAGEAALVSLSGRAGAPHYLQLVPVRGRARDVFHATAAIGVLVARPPSAPRPRIQHDLVRDLFALTDREVDVAALLAEGLTPQEIARRLGVQIGTARNHLKSVFEKTGTSRQAELVALLARLAW